MCANVHMPVRMCVRIVSILKELGLQSINEGLKKIFGKRIFSLEAKHSVTEVHASNGFFVNFRYKPIIADVSSFAEDFVIMSTSLVGLIISVVGRKNCLLNLSPGNESHSENKQTEKKKTKNKKKKTTKQQNNNNKKKKKKKKKKYYTTNHSRKISSLKGNN